jgi:hypothetical protein
MRLYKWDEFRRALGEFLSKIKPGGGEITASDIRNVTLKVAGYSWGAISAIVFARELSAAKKLKFDSVTFTLKVPITVEVLFLIDPVPHGRGCPPIMPTNVIESYNYYQRRRFGKAIFRDPTTGSEVMRFGVGVSFTGHPMGACSEEKCVTTDMATIPHEGVPSNEAPFNGRELMQKGADVNHDTIPWYVHKEAVDELK